MYIWNCDERGVQDVPKETEVLGVTGKKTNNVTSKEQERTSTILTFVNAVEVAFPPVVIHKGRKVSNTWKYGTPQDVIVRASPKGWTNK